MSIEEFEYKSYFARVIWGIIVGGTLAFIGEPALVIATPLPRWVFNLLFVCILYIPSTCIVRFMGIRDTMSIAARGFLIYFSVAILTWIILY